MDINKEQFGGGNGTASDGRRAGEAVHSHEYMDHALAGIPSSVPQIVVGVIGLALTGYLLWCGSYGEALFVLGLTLLALVMVRRRRAGESDEASVEVLKAEFGVPYCKYTPMPDGFECSYKRLPAGIQQMFAGAGAKDAGAIAALMVLLFGGIGALLYMIFGGTKILVTKDEVIINGKRLSRRDFGGFSVHHTVKLSDKTLGVIGCQFGLRSFAFGGAFDEGQAAEVASALNLHLRRTPLSGDENRPSPAQLRAVRTSDY